MSTDDAIKHEPTGAKAIVSKTMLPVESDDLVHALHRLILHATFLYTDLREAIRYEDGNQVLRQWRFRLIYFLGNNRLWKLSPCSAIFMPIFHSILHTLLLNRFVNTTGKEGHGKPLDMIVKHYNLQLFVIYNIIIHNTVHFLHQ